MASIRWCTSSPLRTHAFPRTLECLAATSRPVVLVCARCFRCLVEGGSVSGHRAPSFRHNATKIAPRVPRTPGGKITALWCQLAPGYLEPARTAALSGPARLGRSD